MFRPSSTSVCATTAILLLKYWCSGVLHEVLGISHCHEIMKGFKWYTGSQGHECVNNGSRGISDQEPDSYRVPQGQEARESIQCGQAPTARLGAKRVWYPPSPTNFKPPDEYFLVDGIFDNVKHMLNWNAFLKFRMQCWVLSVSFLSGNKRPFIEHAGMQTLH